MSSDWAYPDDTYSPQANALPLPGWDEILASFMMDDGFQLTRSFEMFFFKMGTPAYDILLKVMDYWKPWSENRRNDLSKKFAPFPGGVPETLHASEKAWVRVLSPILNLQENYAYYVYRLHFDRMDSVGGDKLQTIGEIRTTYFKQRTAAWRFLRTVIDKVVVGVTKEEELDYCSDSDEGGDVEDTKVTNLRAYLLDPLVEEGDGKDLILRMISHVKRLYAMRGPPGGARMVSVTDLCAVQSLPAREMREFLDDFEPKHRAAWLEQCLVEAEQAMDVLFWLVYYLLQKMESAEKGCFVGYFVDLLSIAASAGFGMPEWTGDTGRRAVMEMKWLSLLCLLLSVDDFPEFQSRELQRFDMQVSRILDGAHRGMYARTDSLPLVKYLWHKFLQSRGGGGGSGDYDMAEANLVVRCVVRVVEGAMGSPRTTSIETIFKPELYCDEIPMNISIERSCIVEGFQEGHELLNNLIAITTSISEVLMCDEGNHAVGGSTLLAPNEEHRRYEEQLTLARLIRSIFRGDQALADQHSTLYSEITTKWFPRIQLGDDFADESMEGEERTHTTENVDFAIASISGLAVDQRRCNIFVAAFHTLSITDGLALVTREVEHVTVVSDGRGDGSVQRRSLSAFNLVPPGTAPAYSRQEPGSDFVEVQWPLQNTLMDVFLERLFMQPKLILDRLHGSGRPNLVMHYLGLLDDALRLFLALTAPMQVDVDTVLIMCNRAHDLEQNYPGEMQRLHGGSYSHKPEAVVVELFAAQAQDLCEMLHGDRELRAEERQALYRILTLVIMCLKQLSTVAFWDVKDYLRDFSESVEFTGTVRRVLIHQLCAADLLKHVDIITHVNVMRDPTLLDRGDSTQPFHPGAAATFDLVLQMTGLMRTLIARSNALDGVDLLARFCCAQVDCTGECLCTAQQDLCHCRAVVQRSIMRDQFARVLRVDEGNMEDFLASLFGNASSAPLSALVTFFNSPGCADQFHCPRLRAFCRRVAANSPLQKHDDASVWGDHLIVAVRFAFQVLKYVDAGIDHGRFLRTETGCRLAESALGILQEALGLSAPTMLVSPGACAGSMGLGPVNEEAMRILKEDGELRRSLLRLALAPSLSAVTFSSASRVGPVMPIRFLSGVMGVIGVNPNKIEEVCISAMAIIDKVVNLELLHSFAHAQNEGHMSSSSSEKSSAKRAGPVSQLAVAFFEGTNVDSDDSDTRHGSRSFSTEPTITYLTALCGLVDYPDVPGNCKYMNALPKAALKLLGTVLHASHCSFSQETAAQALGLLNVAPLAQSVASMLVKSVKDQGESYVGQATYTLDTVTILARFQPMLLGSLLSIRATDSDGEVPEDTMTTVLGVDACAPRDGVIVRNLISLIETVLYEGDDAQGSRDAFKLVHHLIFELVMVMCDQESAMLREAAHTLLTHHKFWAAVVRTVAIDLPRDPIIPTTGAEDTDVTKSIMNYCYAVRATASALQLLALQQQKGCISVFSDEDYVAVATQVHLLLDEELRKNHDLWRGWISRFSSITDTTDLHAWLARSAAAQLGLDLQHFVWAQTHTIPDRVGAYVRPLGDVFTTVGRYIYDCQMVYRFTSFLPAPEAGRSGEMLVVSQDDMHIDAHSDSAVKVLCDHFLERVNCLNYSWAVIDARSKLFSNFIEFMVFNVQPRTEMGGGGSSGGSTTLGTPQTPLSSTYLGRTGIPETGGDRRGSNFLGDNRSYAIVKALMKELHQDEAPVEIGGASAQQGSAHVDPILQSILRSESRGVITTVKATLLEQKARLLKDMLFHQVEEISSRNCDPSLSESRLRPDSHLDHDKKYALIEDCLHLVRTRCLEVRVSASDGNPTKCETMRRVAMLHLLTCVLLLWGSLRDRDWRALPERSANDRWMRQRIKVFHICRDILINSLDAQGRPVFADEINVLGGQDKSWVVNNTTLRLIRLVLPQPSELGGFFGNSSASGDVRLMSTNYLEAWHYMLSPPTPDGQPFQDTLRMLVQRLSLVPSGQVEMEHDMARWARCTAADKGGHNVATLLPRTATSTGTPDPNALQGYSSNPCTQLHCLGTALEIIGTLCVPGGLVNVQDLGPSVIDILSSSSLLQTYRDATMRGGEEKASLMPYSTITCDISPITEVWRQTLRLVANVVSALPHPQASGTSSSTHEGAAQPSGLHMRSICTFLSSYSALILLPIRPCSTRYSLGQLRLADASMQLLLCMHPKERSGEVQAFRPIWSVLCPHFINEAYDRVRAMVRAVALLLGDGDPASSGVDFHAYQLDKKTIAVSADERKHPPSLASRRLSRSRGDSGSIASRDSLGSPGSTSVPVELLASPSLLTNSALSATAPTTHHIKSKFLRSMELALLHTMLPAVMLLARVASTQELREAEAFATDAPAASATGAWANGDGDGGGAGLAMTTYHPSHIQPDGLGRDGEAYQGLYPLGTEVWFSADSGGSSHQTLQSGIVVKRSFVQHRKGSTASHGHGHTHSQTLVVHDAVGSSQQVLTDSMLMHGSMDVSRAAGGTHGGHMQLFTTGSSNASSHNALATYNGSSFDADTREGSYHVQRPDGSDAAFVRASQIAFTTPPLLPLKDTVQLKRATDASVLASDAPVSQDPCTTAHVLRLAQYSLSRTAQDRMRDTLGEDATPEQRREAGLLLEALGGNACLTVSAVLKLLSRVRSEPVLEQTRKQVEGMRAMILSTLSTVDRSQAESEAWRRFADSARNTVYDQVKATELTMSRGLVTSPAAKRRVSDGPMEDDPTESAAGDLGGDLLASGGDDIFDY